METRTPTPKKKQMKRKLERAAVDLTDQPSPKTPKLCLQKKFVKTIRNSPVLLVKALFKELSVDNMDLMEGASKPDEDWVNFSPSKFGSWSSEFPFGSNSPVDSDSPFTKAAGMIARF